MASNRFSGRLRMDISKGMVFKALFGEGPPPKACVTSNLLLQRPFLILKLKAGVKWDKLCFFDLTGTAAPEGKRLLVCTLQRVLLKVANKISSTVSPFWGSHTILIVLLLRSNVPSSYMLRFGTDWIERRPAAISGKLKSIIWKATR
jgi:hypothetical protein